MTSPDAYAGLHPQLGLPAEIQNHAGQKLERWQAMQLVDSKDKGLSPANLEMRISSLRKKLTQC